MPAPQKKVDEFITCQLVAKIIQKGPDQRFYPYQFHADALTECDWRITKNQIFRALINAGLKADGARGLGLRDA